MFYGADNLQDVIYNFNFPNESECINKEAKKNETIRRSPNSAYFRNSEAQDRSMVSHRYDPPNRSESLSTWKSRYDNSYQRFSRDDAIQRIASRRAVIPHTPSNPVPVPKTEINTRITKEREVMKALVELGGPSMLVDILRRYASILSPKINVPFRRSMRKDDVINWYKTNWDAIKPFLHEIKPDSF